jgi:hypothetical protein
MDDLIQNPIEILDESHPFWLTKVLNIGTPVLSDKGPDGGKIESAAVVFRKDGDGSDFDFYMNPEFAAGLTDDERAFLISHEAMHVVRNDMAATLDPKYENKQALNLAMDYIVNDTLTNAGLTAPEWAAQGPRDLGLDCEGMDLDEVYQIVMQNPPPPEGGGGEGEEGEGEPGEGEGQGKGKAMNGGGHDGWDQQMADAAEDHGDGDGEGDGEGQPGEGEGQPGGEHGREQKADNPNGQMEQDDSKKDLAYISERDIPNIDYEELFRRIEPDLVDGWGMGHPPRNDWRRPRRNMMSVYPHSNLPSKKDDRNKIALSNKRMQIVVGIDCSASCSATDVALFRKIAERLPAAKGDYIFVATSGYAKEVPAEVVFDPSKQLGVFGASSITNYLRYADKQASTRTPQDLIDAAKLYRDEYHSWRPALGVGEFDALEIWIQAAVKSGRLREYPKSVLIISDAESYLTCNVEAEHAARWTVLSNMRARDIGGRTCGQGMPPQEPQAQYPKRATKVTASAAYSGGMSKMDSIPDQNFVGMPDLVLKDSHVKKRARV